MVVPDAKRQYEKALVRNIGRAPDIAGPGGRRPMVISSSMRPSPSCRNTCSTKWDALRLGGGGLVEGLPNWVAEMEENMKHRSSVEVAIHDRREKKMSDAGFLALIQTLNSDFAVFFSAPSCAKPNIYRDDTANANSRLSCQLQYILTASRFMHYLKVMARDYVGSYHTRSELEKRLNQWISRYVCLDDQASPAIRATPRREIYVTVLSGPAGQNDPLCRPRIHQRRNRSPIGRPP